MIDDVHEEIPSCPSSPLIYALWSSGLLGIKPPPLIYYLPFGVANIQAHAPTRVCGY